MPRRTVPLTNTEIKNAKPKEKDYKLYDGEGLFLLVAKTGGKRWRLKYRFNNKEKTIALGIYPAVSLKDARETKDKYKSMIAKGIDPSAERKQKKEEIKLTERKKKNTFYKISQEWHENYKSEVTENYHNKLERALENYIYPFIGKKSIEEITRLNIINILKTLKEKNIIETANRVYMLLNKIYKYAVTLEYVPHNIIADIEKKRNFRKNREKTLPYFHKRKRYSRITFSY